MSLTADAPFAARRAIQMAAEEADRAVAEMRAAGLTVTEEQLDSIVATIGARVLDEMPEDAQRYFVREGLAAFIAEHEAGKAAGK